MMIKIDNPSPTEWNKLTGRVTKTAHHLENAVSEVFTEVQRRKDVALHKYTQLFDGVTLSGFTVELSEMEEAISEVSDELKAAIDLAKTNITKFHTAQQRERVFVETSKGVLCWQEQRPIEKVGLYIPGGSAPLFSTILMLAIPATLAGCKEIVLCTPPGKDGNINPAILYTAEACGIKTIFKVGGIQAIAGLTFGTESIPKVDKIFGPGNQFVTAAKQLSTKYGVAIDMPAGPSELLVFADDTANASFVASDLLSQAEHGKDSQVILVSTSKTFIQSVEAKIEDQIINLPRIKIVSEVLKNTNLIFMKTEKIALDFINAYAPEHLIVVSKKEDYFLKHINNAGSVFVGSFSAESAGDYASGTNHTLPTNGFAKQYSGVSLDSFTKSITFQKINKEGIQIIGPAVELMAQAEGLLAHKRAISLRLDSLKKGDDE